MKNGSPKSGLMEVHHPYQPSIPYIWAVRPRPGGLGGSVPRYAVGTIIYWMISWHV